MYKPKRVAITTLAVNTSYLGERIEEKIERIVNNKEPISDGAPLIYTERKDGVQPEYDVRTDRFEVAVEAMDKVTGSHQAKREQRLKGLKGGKADEKNEGGETGGQSIQGTESK